MRITSLASQLPRDETCTGGTQLYSGSKSMKRRFTRRHFTRDGQGPAGAGEGEEGGVARPCRAAQIHAGCGGLEGDVSAGEALRFCLCAEDYRTEAAASGPGHNQLTNN